MRVLVILGLAFGQKNYNQDLQAQRTKLQSVTSDLQRKALAAQQEMQSSSISFVTKSGANMNQINADIEGVMGDTSMKESDMTTEATAVSKAAGEEQTRVTKGHTMATKAIEDAQKVIEDKVKATDEQQTQKTNENTFAFTNRLNELTMNARGQKDELMEELNEAASTHNDAVEELNEHITDELEGQQEAAEGADELYKETRDIVKEANKNSKNSWRENQAALNNIARNIEMSKGQLSAAGVAATKSATEEATDIQKETLAEIRSFLKDASDEARDMGRNYKEGDKETQAEFKEANKDVQEEINDNTAEEDEVLGEQNELRSEADQIKTSTTNSFEALRKMETQSVEDQKNQENQVIEQQQIQLKQAAAQMQNEAKAIEVKGNQAVEQVTAKNNQNRMALKAATEKEIAEAADQSLVTIQESKGEALATAMDEKIVAESLTSKTRSQEAQLNKGLELVGSVAEAVKTKGAQLAQTVAQVTENFGTAIKEAASGVDEYKEEMAAAVAKETDNARSAARGLVEGAKSSLEAQIQQVKYASDATSATDKATFNNRVQNLKDEISVLRDEETEVTEKSQSVQEKAPAAQNLANEALAQIKEAYSEAVTTYQSVLDEIQTKIDAEASTGKDTVDAYARETMAKTDEATNSAKATIQQEIEVLKTMIGDITTAGVEQEQQDTADGQAFRTKLSEAKAQLDAMTKGAEILQEQVAGKASQQKRDLKDMIREVQQNAAKMSQQTVQKVGAAYQDAMDKGDQGTKATMQEAAKSMQESMSAAHAQLMKDAAETEEYFDRKNEKISAAQDEESKLAEQVQKEKGLAENTVAGLKRNTFSLVTKAAREEDEATKSMQAERDKVAKQTKLIEDSLVASAGQLRNSNAAKLKTQKDAENDQIKSLAQKLSLQLANTNKAVNGFTTGADGILANLDRQQNLTQEDVEKLTGMSQEALSALLKEQQDLQKSVVVSGDDTAARQTNAESQGNDVHSDELSNLERITALVQKIQGQANTAAQDLSDESSAELNEKASFTTGQIRSVVAKMNQIVGSGPDLAKDFNDDTVDTRESLNQTLIQLMNSSVKVDDMVAQIEGKLDVMRKNRESRALTAHTSIMDTKSTAANKLQELVQIISTMQREAKAKAKKMIGELRAFKERINGVSSIEVAHEQEEIDGIGEKSAELKRGHQANDMAKTRMRHQASAFRRAANENLGAIYRKMGYTDDEIDAAMVDEQMDLNKDLRNMMMQMQDEIANNAVGESKFFGQTVDGVLGKLGNVLGDEVNIQDLKDGMSRDLKAALSADEKSVNREMGELDENGDKLSQKARETRQNMVTQMQQLKGELALPMATMKDGAKTEAHMQQLKSKISTLGSESLLEEGSTVLTAEAEKAVRDLNSQLEAENAKMRRENARLLAGVQSVKLAHGLK